MPSLKSIRANTTVAKVTGSQAIAAGGAAIASILMARVVGADGRGLVAFSLTIAYICLPLVSLGLSRYLLRGDWETRPALSALLLLPSAVGVAVSLLAAVATPDPYVYLAPLVTVGVSAVLIARADGLARGDTRLLVSLQLSVAAFTLMWSLVLFAVGSTEPLLWLAPHVAVGLVAVGVSLRGLTVPLGGWLGQIWGGIRQVPGELGQLVALRLDRLLLPLICGPAELGVYVMAATAMEVSMWLVVAVADSRVRVLREAGTTFRFTALARDFVWVAALVGLAAAATKFLLLPFLGQEFAGAASLLLPLTIGSLFLGLSTLAGAHLLASSRPGTSVYPRLAMAVVAVPVYFLGILEACELGAAWGTVGVYGVGFACTSALAVHQRRVNS